MVFCQAGHCWKVWDWSSPLKINLLNAFLCLMQASVNETKATIAELETAREEQTDDISSLVIILFLLILF